MTPEEDDKLCQSHFLAMDLPKDEWTAFYLGWKAARLQSSKENGVAQVEE